jgi:hypothetical protein
LKTSNTGASVVEVRERPAPVPGAVDDPSERRGKELRSPLGEGVLGARLAQNHDQTSALLDELGEQPRGVRGKRWHVVQDHDVGPGEIGGPELRKPLRRFGTRPIADPEGSARR